MSEVEEILAEVEKKRRDESHLYDNFEEYYRKRDLVKAGEFLWGCINQLAYSLGRLYGKKLGKHREIIQFMKEIAEERREERVREWIHYAEALHSNYYHGWMEEDIFEDYVRKVIELKFWLTRVLDEKIKIFLKPPVS